MSEDQRDTEQSGKKGGREAESQSYTSYNDSPLAGLPTLLEYGSDYSSGEERTLRDYPLILLRYWALMLTMIAIGACFAIYQTSKAPKLYRSVSMINIGSYVPPLEGPTGATLRQETQSRNYSNTQIRLLRSATLAEKVLRENQDILRFLDPTYSSTEKTATPQKFPPHLLQAYLSVVSFYSLPQTSLVEIYVTSTSPLMAARIANAHSNSFIGLVQERRQQAAEVNLRFLRDRHQEARTRFEEGENARIAFTEENAGIVREIELGDQAFSARYQGLMSALNGAVAGKAQAEADYKRIRRSQGKGGSEFAEKKLELTNIEANYNNWLKRLRTSRHPLLFNLKHQMDTLKDTINTLGKERIKEARAEYMVESERERSLRREFDKLHAEQVKVGKMRIEYDRMKAESDSAKQMLEVWEKRLDEAMINVESNQETVAIVDKAFVPTHHISPNEASNLWSGCLMGALMGVMLAFLLDYLDTRVRSVKDLQSVVKAPVLGVVPKFSRGVGAVAKGGRRGEEEVWSVDTSIPSGKIIDPSEEESPETKIIVLDEESPVLPISMPHSTESEAFRNILATLTSDDSPYAPRQILITSGQQGEGKTTLAVNLAATLAQMGEKTLLIDADLRIPNVHGYFGYPRDIEGVSDVLNGGADPMKLIVGGGVQNLSLLLAGTITPNPAALVRSKKMAELIDSLSAHFDYILIDSPPVTPVADALLLSRHVDGVALVVRSGETSRAIAESSIARLRQVGANILGLVLNDSSRVGNYWKGGGYYNYGYGPYGREYK